MKKTKRGRPGRPPKYLSEFHPRSFIELSKQGKNLTQIAFEWDLDRDTIYDWGKKYKAFSDAIKRGRQYSEAWYTNLGQAAMIGQARVDGERIQFNLGAYVWLTKNLFKWSDKREIQTADSNSDRPLKHLTDEELDALHEEDDD